MYDLMGWWVMSHTEGQTMGRRVGDWIIVCVCGLVSVCFLGMT